MARTLDEFPERIWGRPGSDWDEYLDGQVWEIDLGDFPNYKDLRSLRAGFLDMCNRRGLVGRTSRLEDSLVVQVTGQKESVA